MKITTQIDVGGVLTAREIEVADEQIIAQGFMPTAKFTEELTRRGVSIATKQGYVKPEDLTPEQITELAKTKGVKLGESDPGKTATAIEEATSKQREAWDRTELAPVKTKVTELETENTNLLQDKLYSAIVVAAAAAGVEDSMLRAPKKNMLPPIVSMLADAFGFDTDTKQFLVVSDDGEGFAFSSKPSEEHPFKDVEEFVGEWAGNKDNAKFIKVTAQRGPNLQGVVSGRPGQGPVHLSKADSRNARVIEAAKAEATKRGLDPYNGGIVYDSN